MNIRKNNDNIYSLPLEFSFAVKVVVQFNYLHQQGIKESNQLELIIKEWNNKLIPK